MLDSSKGISIKPKRGQNAIFKEYTIKLINGENNISAVVFNADNTMRSNPATHRVIADIKTFKNSERFNN